MNSKCYAGIFMRFIKSFIKNNTALRWEHLLCSLTVAAPRVVAASIGFTLMPEKVRSQSSTVSQQSLCILSDPQRYMCEALSIRSGQTMTALLSSEETFFGLFTTDVEINISRETFAHQENIQWPLGQQLMELQSIKTKSSPVTYSCRFNGLLWNQRIFNCNENPRCQQAFINALLAFIGDLLPNIKAFFLQGLVSDQ